MLPPAVAPTQVVLVPILTSRSSGETGETTRNDDVKILDRLHSLAHALRKSGVRCQVDCRSDVRPGAKYFEWERKGVPLRLVLGPKDVSLGAITMVERIAGKKEIVDFTSEDAVVARVISNLETVQSALYAQAEARLQARTHRVTSYSEMCSLLTDSGDGGFFLVPWKDCADNEQKIKEDCKMTLRCFPYDHNQSPPAPGIKCFFSNEQATHMALFARAY